MLYNLCLFDLDGVLIESGEGITKSVRYALNSFGIEVADLSELNRFVGPPLIDAFMEYYNFSDADARKATSKYREYFSKTGIWENVLYDGIVDMLVRLKDNGVKMAIVTTKPGIFAEKIAVRFDIKQYFDFIAGSELDNSRTNKNELINYALDILDSKREMVPVMIGDREHDIIGAVQVGIDSIGITWGYGSRTELEKAKATKIINSPNELCQLVLG